MSRMCDRNRIGLAFATTLLALAGAARAVEPLRVAALVPFVEDALRPHPAAVALVAAVRHDLRQPPALPAVDLGNPHSPSYEQLASARPALVVGELALHGALRERLALGGAEVMLIDSTGIRSTFDGLTALGRRVGLEPELAAAVSQAEREIDALAIATPRAVLPLFGTPGSFYAFTRRSWVGELIERVGFRNLAAEATDEARFPGLAPLNDEVLSSFDPELLLLVGHGDPSAIRAALGRRIAEAGVWQRIRASARGGVHVLDPKLFSSNPGLALPQAARALRAIADLPASAATR